MRQFVEYFINQEIINKKNLSFIKSLYFSFIVLLAMHSIYYKHLPKTWRFILFAYNNFIKSNLFLWVF